MKEMVRLIKERGVNRSMTSVLKDSRHSLDRIKVRTFDWYYSAAKTEMCHHATRGYTAREKLDIHWP